MQFDCKKFDRTWRIRICVGHGEGRGQGHGEGRGGEKKASSLVHNAMIKGGPRKIF